MQMPLKSLKSIYKIILVTAILLFLRAITEEWSNNSYSVDPIIFKPRDKYSGFGLIKSTRDNKAVSKRTKVFDSHIVTHEKESKSKTQSEKRLSKNDPSKTIKNVYGIDCPTNPYKQTLKYLFKYWITLDNYFNLSSFLCRGSLIGSLRDGDLIPYDRDIDVCVILENYQKVRAIRSQKPFRSRSNKIHLAVQEDFFNSNVSNKIRVNCQGRIVLNASDPCSFDTPGARLISRGVHVDVNVFREHGRNLRDHEYDRNHLKTDVFPLKDCTFMGVETKCPRNEMAYLLKYYKPDVITKPFYKCKKRRWVSTSQDAKKHFRIWFDKRLKPPNSTRS